MCFGLDFCLSFLRGDFRIWLALAYTYSEDGHMIYARLNESQWGFQVIRSSNEKKVLSFDFRTHW